MEIKFILPEIKRYIFSLEYNMPQRVFRVINLLEKFGNNLLMPYSRSLGKGLFELRIKGNKEIRIFYCFYKQQAVLLHIFTKKTKNIPIKELNIAKLRMKDLTEL